MTVLAKILAVGLSQLLRVEGRSVDRFSPL